jgi:hypothetical protein
MAYEMLTGGVPFRGASAIAVLRKHLEEPPPPLAAARPGLPPELEAAVMRALAKRPEERYASAGELAADLVRIGSTPELAELAAASLPATAQTIVGAPITRTAQTLRPAAPTVAAAPPAAVGYRRGLLIAGAVAAGLLALLVAAGLGLRSCRQGPGNVAVQPPVPPKPEPGFLGDLVLPDGKRFRVRLLNWEGSLAKVVELPGGTEKIVETPPGTTFEPAPAQAPPAPPPGGAPKQND